jgi:hypothetical protein
MLGLPGSGKSTVSKELEQTSHGKAKRVDFDSLFEQCWWRKGNERDRGRNIREKINDGLGSPMTERLILDGLFLTYEDVVRIVSNTHMFFNQINIVIHQFNEDRETCVKNDGGRRETSSTNTIMHAEFNQIDGKELLNKLKEKGCENIGTVAIKYHKVVLKPDWDRYFRSTEAYVWEDGKMRSDKWCTGGSYGSCWSDKLSPVTPDDQPEFEALDELLTKICPNVTFLQYKKIMRDCVRTEESYESDYYGGGCTYNRYVCDMKRLYETLRELGYNVVID